MVPTYYPDSVFPDGAIPVVVHSLELREDVNIRIKRSPSKCLVATLAAPHGAGSLDFALEDEAIASVRDHQTTLPRKTGTTGPNGAVRLCDLYAGMFRLTGFSAIPRIGLPEHIGSAAISLNKEDIQEAKLVAGPPMTITGAVVWDEAPPRDTTSATVIVTPQPGSSTRRVSVSGDFSLAVDSAGEYSFLIAGLAPPLYVKDINYGGTSILRKAFVPALGEGQLRIIIGHNAGNVTVKVLSEDSQPAADLSVVIMSADVRSVSELATAVMVGHTNDDGSYTAAGLAPGHYYVLASRESLPGVITLPAMEFSLEKTPSTLAKLLGARSRAAKMEIRAGATVQVTIPSKAIIRSFER